MDALASDRVKLRVSALAGIIGATSSSSGSSPRNTPSDVKPEIELLSSTHEVRQVPREGSSEHSRVTALDHAHARAAAAETEDAAAVAAAAAAAAAAVAEVSNGECASVSLGVLRRLNDRSASQSLTDKKRLSTSKAPPRLPAAVGICPPPAAQGNRCGGRKRLRPRQDTGRESRADAAVPAELFVDGADPDIHRPGAGTVRAPARREKKGKCSRAPRPGKECVNEGCTRRPTFGFPGDPYACWCKAHKMDGHVDISSRRCESEGCTVIPSFRFATEKGARFCARHKVPGMHDYHRDNRQCRTGQDCARNPSFGFEGGKRISCAQHKAEGMVNLNIHRCQESGCNLTPYFNYQGYAPIFCASHRSEGMINVVSKRCEDASCEKIPSYNWDVPGNKAAFCNVHKAAGMVNVRHPRCARENCRRQPSFGKAGGKVALYCKEHKEVDMIDVKNKDGRRKRA